MSQVKKYSERTTRQLNTPTTGHEITPREHKECEIRMLERKLQIGCPNDLKPGYELKLLRLKEELKSM